MPTAAPIRPRLPRVTRRLVATALVAGVVPLAGCGGGSSSSGSGDADPAAVLPATTAVYGEVTVHPSGDVKADVTALVRKIARTNDPGPAITKAVEGVLGDDTNYEKDIKPWLGDKIGAAITGLQNPSHPDFAFVLAAKDTGKALSSLKNGTDNLVDRKYQGTTYTYNRDIDQAALTEKGTLVVGSEPAIKQIIDTKKSGETLAESRKLKDARASVSSGALGFAYLDPSALVDLAASATPYLAGQGDVLKGLFGGQNVSALGVGLFAKPAALRVETAVKGAATTGAGTGAAQTVADAPAGSTLALGLGDLGKTFKTALASVGQLGGIYGSVLGQFEQFTGLNLQRDVISWMGEAGVFVKASSLADLGGALVVDTSSPAKTTRFLTVARRLVNQFAGAGSQLSATPFSGEGAKGFTLQIPGFPFPVIAATGRDKLVIAVGRETLADALRPSGSLADDPQFKATATQLGQKPSLYVDVASVTRLLGLAAGSDPTLQAALPYLESLTSLAAGGSTSGTTSKGALVVTVK